MDLINLSLRDGSGWTTGRAGTIITDGEPAGEGDTILGLVFVEFRIFELTGGSAENTDDKIPKIETRVEL